MPDTPVGTKQYRVTRAIHLHFTTEKTQAEIADDLGVSQRKVAEYVQEPPADEVRSALEHQETQVRMVAFEELKRQLQEAGARARSAETPVKVWTDDDGHLHVRDKHHPETGEVTGKVALPADMEMGPDHTERYYRREEVREILDRLIDLTGAAEPDQIEVEGSTDVGLDDDDRELLEEAFDL